MSVNYILAADAGRRYWKKQNQKSKEETICNFPLTNPLFFFRATTEERQKAMMDFHECQERKNISLDNS